MRSRNPARWLLAAVLALALVAPLDAARADDLEPPADGPNKVVSYFGCALALATAITPIKIAGAMLICIHVVLDEIPRE